MKTAVSPSTACARRKRARQWQLEARGASTCPHRHGPGRCGAVIETRIINGQTEIHCPACERRLAGLCRVCPRPVAGQIGKATRCADCRDRKKAEDIARYAARNADAIRRRAKAAERRRKKDPERRTQILARKRAWRKANPDRVAAHKRRDALKHRDRILAYHKAYNAERLEAKREHARRQYYATHPQRPAPVCRTCGDAIVWEPPGRPPVRCVQCIPPSLAARRRSITGARAAIPPAPVTTRTCLTCPTPLTGRAKRCEPCKVQTFVRARKVLWGLERAS